MLLSLSSIDTRLRERKKKRNKKGKNKNLLYKQSHHQPKLNGKNYRVENKLSTGLILQMGNDNNIIKSIFM